MATTTINVNATIDGLSNVDSTGKATGDVLEWNGTSGKWEAVTPSGGGGTPAGTSGQVQFNDSGSFGADSAFHWDNTNKRLGVGATPASTVRLDVRAQGSLSTDIAFRVRNSVNTIDVFKINGDLTAQFRRSSNNEDTLRIDAVNNYVELFKTDAAQHRGIRFSKNSGILNSMEYFTQNTGASGHFLFKASAPSGGFGTSIPGFVFDTGFGSTFSIVNNHRVAIGNEATNVLTSSGLGTFVLYTKNGIAPISGIVDNFAMYSADIVAGNAAPHFRTENGAVIKLYQQSSAGITTVADLVTILQNLGLLS